MLEPAPSSPAPVVLPSTPSASRDPALGRPAPVEGTSVPTSPSPAALGGYRVVRRLGGGSTAAVLLARGGGASVALRCYRDGVPDARIDAEIESLGRLRSRHLVALLDLATGGDGRPVPVLDAVIGPGLDEWLRARHGSIEPGEAVTVLAPLAELLHELHEVGVVVGRWSPAGVRIGADGAPVLTAMSGLLPSPPLPARFRRHEPGVLADLAGLRGLGEQVVAAVRPDRRDALLRALEPLNDALSLPQALFDAARPAPLVVALAAERHGTGAILSPDGRERPEAGGTAPSQAASRTAPGLLGTVGRVLDDLGVPPSVVDAVRHVGDRLTVLPSPQRRGRRRAPTPLHDRRTAGDPRPRSARRPSSTRPRRSVVLIGAAGLIALLASIGVLILDEQGSGSAVSRAADESASVPPAAGGAAMPSTDGSTGGAPTDAVDGSPLPGADASAVAAIDSDAEPAPHEWGALVAGLAERWIDCRAPARSEERTASCADSVVQPGSAAADLLMSPGTTAVDDALARVPAEVVVADRLGSAALVELIHEDGTRTASLLVMRSEAGWRVRSILD